MMSEAERIAEGLPATLRREVCALDARPSDRTISWCVRYGYRLEKIGLVRRKLLTDRPYLTPLGLEVRKVLEASK